MPSMTPSCGKVAGLKADSDPRLKIRVSTADGSMDDEDYGVLIEQAIVWAAADLGIVIPDPRKDWKRGSRSGAP